MGRVGEMWWEAPEILKRLHPLWGDRARLAFLSEWNELLSGGGQLVVGAAVDSILGVGVVGWIV